MQNYPESELDLLLLTQKRHPANANNEDLDIVAGENLQIRTNDFDTSRELPRSPNQYPADPQREYESSLDANCDAACWTLEPGQTLPGTGFRIIPHGETDERLDPEAVAGLQVTKTRWKRIIHPPLPPVELTPSDVLRWRMAWYACDKNALEPPSILRTPFTKRCNDWPDIKEILQFPIAIGFCTAALIYGGLHALAWNAHFNSPTELLLWRLSSCIVMGGTPCAFLLSRLADHDRSHNLITGLFVFFLPNIPCCLLMFAYTLARAYLVVECFINLSHLPAGVYANPEWTTYFPHIS